VGKLTITIQAQPVVVVKLTNDRSYAVQNLDLGCIEFKRAGQTNWFCHFYPGHIQ
jgi:hypothetical protein